MCLEAVGTRQITGVWRCKVIKCWRLITVYLGRYRLDSSQEM